MTFPLPETIVLTVKRVKSDTDPRIALYTVEFVTSNPNSVWPEAFGSLEQLRAYLLGLKTALHHFGFGASLNWDIPERWVEPSGLRWTLVRDKCTKREELDGDGEVIKI